MATLENITTLEELEAQYKKIKKELKQDKRTQKRIILNYASEEQQKLLSNFKQLYDLKKDDIIHLSKLNNFLINQLNK